MNENNKENSEKSPSRSVLRKVIWTTVIILALGILIPLALGIYVNIATPGPPEQLTAMVEACEERSEGCPDYVIKFRAFQQIYLMDADVARKFIPPDVELISFFGLTPGAIFVAEYSYLSYDDPPTYPAGNNGSTPGSLYREVDVLQLAANGPGGMMGAWASHVLVTHPIMIDFARNLGLPAQLAPKGITVKHNCAEPHQGIEFDIGTLDGTIGPERILGISACLPHGPGQGSMDLTELKNHTLPNLTGRISKNKAHVYAVEPHTTITADLTDFMLYLFTFWKATIRLSSPVPQSAAGDSQAALLFAELLKGPILPFATVFDGVESTVWDTLERKDGEWKRSKIRYKKKK